VRGNRPSAEQVDAGQAVYNRGTLRAYDFVVLGISNRWVWKCPTWRLEQQYQRHVTSNHLDVGVGTGYFLDHCRFPTPAPRVALLDLNQNALDFAARRITRYWPLVWRRNVLEPLQLDAAGFDSVALGNLLHCLPGRIESKAIVFDHLLPLMNSGAVLFGSTLLQGGVRRGRLAHRLMKLYNRKRIFSNEGDDLHALRCELDRRFGAVSIEVVGCAALFAARQPLTS
jgi:hypothetical protein